MSHPHTHPATAAVLILSLVFLTAGPAVAGTYTASVDTPFSQGHPYWEHATDTAPVSVSNSLVGNHIWQGEASAGLGNLGVLADAWSNGDYYPSPLHTAAYAYLKLDDLVFTSPNNDPIDVTLYLILDGTFTRDVNGNGEATSTGVSFRVEFHNKTFIGSYSVSESFSGNGTYAHNESPAGELSSLTGDEVQETLALFVPGVPVNVPVHFNMKVEVTANASQWTCRAVSDFADTFRFRSGSPVFAVPVGISVDSEDAAIADNMWPSSPVPVEATTWGTLKQGFAPKH